MQAMMLVDAASDDSPRWDCSACKDFEWLSYCEEVWITVEDFNTYENDGALEHLHTRIECTPAEKHDFVDGDKKPCPECQGMLTYNPVTKKHTFERYAQKEKQNTLAMTIQYLKNLFGKAANVIIKEQHDEWNRLEKKVFRKCKVCWTSPTPEPTIARFKQNFKIEYRYVDIPDCSHCSLCKLNEKIQLVKKDSVMEIEDPEIKHLQRMQEMLHQDCQTNLQNGPCCNRKTPPSRGCTAKHYYEYYKSQRFDQEWKAPTMQEFHEDVKFMLKEIEKKFPNMKTRGDAIHTLFVCNWKGGKPTTGEIDMLTNY